MPQTAAAEPLKAERIQSKLKAERIQEKLKAERIQERLAEVPGWRASGDPAALTRTYDLPTLRGAGLFVALALEVAEATGYTPEIDVRGCGVTVRVATVPGHGIVDLDFDWAKLLDGGRAT